VSRAQRLRARKAEPREQRSSVTSRLGARHTLVLKRQTRVVERAPPRKQAIALRHQRATLQTRHSRSLAAHGHGSGVRLVQARDERQQRRLADTAPADDPQPTVCRHADVDAVEHALPAQHAHHTGERNAAVRVRPRRGFHLEHRLRHTLPSPA